MIYGKLWLVVKPSVGIPVFLGAVALSSFSVHYMLVTNTDWVKRFLNGGPPAATAAIDSATKTASAPPPQWVATAPRQ